MPLGGKPRKSINKALEIQVNADKLAFEQSYASICSNIATGGFVVTTNAKTLEMLKNCNSEIKKTQVVARSEPPVVNNNSDLEQLKKENAELKLLISQLAEKLDNQQVKGGY